MVNDNYPFNSFIDDYLPIKVYLFIYYSCVSQKEKKNDLKY